MSAAFPDLPRMGFMGVEFPVESYRVRGSLRHHVHEYPYQPGGNVEKLGRKLYEVEAVANFQNTFTRWPGLWPGRLNLLRSIFESGETATLIIPSIGGLQAVAVEWEQEFVSRVLSGEKAHFKFLEDDETAFAFQKLVSVKTESLSTLSDNVVTEFELAGIDQSFTDQIVGSVNAVLAVLDTVDLVDQLVAAKIGMIASLCREFDKRIDQFQNVEHYRALDAMKDLWLAAQELAGNTAGEAIVFGIYTVPVQMDISAVSIALYGTTDRSIELMQLNPIEDAFDIPPGTRLRYAKTTPIAAAA